MECCVYVHLRDRVPFYVGIGKEGRPVSRKKRNKFHLSVWDKSEEEGSFEVLVVWEGRREDCGELEKSLIRQFGKRVDGGLLCNFTDGGDGGLTLHDGNRQQVSDLKRKQTTELWKDPEQRENHRKGMEKSNEQQRQSALKRKEDPVKKENHRKSVQKRGKYTQEELNEKYGSMKKGRKWWVNPETGETSQSHESPGPDWIKGRNKPTV